MIVDQSVAQPRFESILLSVFAAAALLLASLGIYGVISYSVIQGREEIGVRIALGVPRAGVLRMVLTEAAARCAGSERWSGSLPAHNCRPTRGALPYIF